MMQALASAGLFSLGFVIGSFAASVIAVVVMAVMTSGKFADMQDRIDELEAQR
jgi:hypothetical protein